MFVPSRVPVRRTGLFIAIACSMLLPAPAFAQAANAPDTAQAQTSSAAFDIPAQDLEDALIRFSRQTRLELFFSDNDVAGKTSAAIAGNMTHTEALQRLLSGTGLAFERTASGGVMVGDPATLSGTENQTGGTPPPRNDAALVASAGAASASDALRNVRVEEVYVTARKREETVQDIPFSITAFSAEELSVTGIRNVGDMEGIVPGLNMGGGGNGVKKDSNPFIRGVGQRETKVTLDPAVGTYIDGIYLARTAGALLDTVGMERVEVLRGPQGTLFGKNVTGGAISFTTVKPHEELGGSISVNVGNYGRSDVAGVLNLPLIGDTLLSRFTLSSKNSDGYFTNVVDNTKWGDDNRITGIGQLRWLPTDNLTFDLLAERTRIRETPRPTKCKVVRPLTPRRIPKPPEQQNPNYPPEHLFNTVANPDFEFNPYPIEQLDNFSTDQGNPDDRKKYSQLCEESNALSADKFASDFSEGNDLLDKGRYWINTSTVGLTATWDIGQLGPLNNTTLKSISAWRKVEQIADEDLDSVAGPYLLRIQDGFNETKQVSQEFQFTGLALDDRLFFSTGLYYLQEETPQDVLVRTAGITVSNFDPVFNRYMVVAFEPTRETLETDNKTYAWYGQLDYDLTSRMQLTLGLRYSHEERWSRYTKAYAIPNSMVLSETGVTAGSAQLFFAIPAPGVPGFTKALDWQFSGPESNRWGSKSASTTDEAWTPMVSLKYNFTDLLQGRRIDDAMAYATYSEGFKAGGVTAGAVDTDNLTSTIKIESPIIFEPETVKNYEIGLKLQALQRRIQANIAVFYTDYTDMQVTSAANRLGVPIPFVDNVGNSTIQGVEGEFLFMPTANWRVMFNTSYTEADMKEWDARQVLLQPLTGRPLDDYTFLDRSDEPMPRVPRWQAFLLTEYTFPLANGGVLIPSIAARYTSETYHGFDRSSYVYGKDAVTSDPVTFVDGRISYLSADQKLSVSLWGKNLTDKRDYLVGAMPLVDTTGAIGEIYGNPRTFGLEMTYRFGGE